MNQWYLTTEHKLVWTSSNWFFDQQFASRVICGVCVNWGLVGYSCCIYVLDDLWEGLTSVSQQLLKVQLIWFIAVTVTEYINWYLLNNMCHALCYKLSDSDKLLTLFNSMYCSLHSLVCGSWLISNQSLIGFPWPGTHGQSFHIIVGLSTSYVGDSLDGVFWDHSNF